MGSNPKQSRSTRMSYRGGKKELDSLSKGGVRGVEGGPLGVLGYVPDLRSSFQKLSALGEGGSFRRHFLASIVPGKEIWRLVVLRVVPEI